CRLQVSGTWESAGGCPRPGDRIIQLRGQVRKTTTAPDYKHLAALEQGGRMIKARKREAAGKTPTSSGRVVELSGCLVAQAAAGYQHLAGLQQGGRVLGRWDHETACTFELKRSGRAWQTKCKRYA